MRDLKVWMRVGDQDDYHCYDLVDEAAAALHDHLGATVNDTMPLRRYAGPALVGIEIPAAGYAQENGISLYWGDEDAQYEVSLSDEELRVFERTFHAG